MPLVDKRDIEVPTASAAQITEIRRLHDGEYGVSALQVIESVAYSMAMVVRTALGLHAENGSIAILYHDSLAGWIAIATARHLSNSGCAITLVADQSQSRTSALLTQLLKPLQYLKLPRLEWCELVKNGNCADFLSSCHNLILGISAIDTLAIPLKTEIIEALNEHSIPVHCIEAPLGISLDTPQRSPEVLYASSTLSLGIPLHGLLVNQEWVGRHYLADISLPPGLISAVTKQPFPLLFSEQPVIQLFPPAPEEA